MSSRSNAARPKKAGSRPRTTLEARRVQAAFERLGRHRALTTLIRAGVPAAVLRRLLKDAVPRKTAEELPKEVWASLAVGIVLENADFALVIAEALHDHLGWDRDVESLDALWPVVTERPLEALWLAALSSNRQVRKEFGHIAFHCVENFRASAACDPPSWEFVEGILDVHSRLERKLREWERRAEEAERRVESEHQRVEELQQELRRLRRENAEQRTGRAQAERRAGELAERAESVRAKTETERLAELERRTRKAEKERDHLLQELERFRQSAVASDPAGERDDGPDVRPRENSAPAPAVPGESLPAPSRDPNPRRRLMRQVLKKLVTKGKIGASHTHQDNIFRGIADHEKGLAKQVIDLLYREGLLISKPTAADPHVSLNAERLPEVRALMAGEIDNPRLLRFVAAS